MKGSKGYGHPCKLEHDEYQRPNPIYSIRPLRAAHRRETATVLRATRVAAASHAIVVGNTVHYLWAKKGEDGSWVHMHSSAPVADPTVVTHDQRNPILLPSADGFDNHGVEYPFPFWNPADQRYYAYYLGTQGKDKPAANRPAC